MKNSKKVIEAANQAFEEMMLLSEENIKNKINLFENSDFVKNYKEITRDKFL